MRQPEPDHNSHSRRLSKRAARRVIQRAIVLAGRDRHVRDHIRQESLLTSWTIEDCGIDWTVEIHCGRLHFERRPAKKADVFLTWQAADAFFSQVGAGRLKPESVEYAGPPPSPRVLEVILRAFCASLHQVLDHPVDENGDPLV